MSRSLPNRLGPSPSRPSFSITIAMLSGLALAIATPTIASPSRAHGPIHLMVELESPSTVEAVLAAESTEVTAVAREHLKRLDREQTSFLAALASETELEGNPLRKAEPIFRLSRVLNAVAVRLPPDANREALDRLLGLPGVRRARAMAPKVRTHTTTLPFLGVPPIWDGTTPDLAGTGLTGSGLRIGIIDTGIDYLHTDFGGSGLAADYAANDTTTLDGFFPTAKVAGGFDFVGDAYDASSTDPMASMPNPDPDPMDCDGHGSHVAGTAAGFGVTAAGTTYGGPYDSMVDLSPLRIGPGVAPEATLYALRVFGCSGTTNVVELALEWAVDPNGDGDFSDHLDVVNLSLASRFGQADDPTADAADTAALAGVVVVASAGNDGDVTFGVGTPASADRAIAVASVWDDDPAFPTRGVRIATPPSIAGTYRALGANFGPGLPMPIAADGALTVPADACSPLTNGPAVAGRIAVIERSDACTEPTRVRHAQDAGAIAVVISHHEPELLIGLLNDGTGGDIVIPPVVIPRPAGQALIQALLGSTVPVEIAQVPLGDTIALNSSRGPRLGPDVAIKPDVAAPGVLVTSAQVGNSIGGGTGARLLSGTSMAAPHVAGTAALILERRPAWSPADVKAAIMGTASGVFLDPENTPPRHGSSRVGAGRIQPRDAVATQLLVYDASSPERVGLSFGHLEVVDVESRERSIRLENRGATPLDVHLSIDGVADLPGLDLALGSPSTTVPAGGMTDVVLQLEARAADLRHSRDTTQAETLFGFPRHWPSEETAFVRIEPTDPSAPELRLPIFASARPASRTTATGPLEVGPATTGTADLGIAGVGVDTGSTPPSEERSLLTALELHYLDGDATELTDLAAVGVASNAATVGLANATLYFAIATGEDVPTPTAAHYEIFLDTNGDGIDDFLLYASDEGTFNFGSFATDGFVSVLRDLGTNAESIQLPLEVLGSTGFHTVPFHTNVRVLAVRAADLGIGPGGGPLGYRVEISEALSGSAVAESKKALPISSDRGGRRVAARTPFRQKASQTPTLRFDPENPGLDATGGLDGAPIHFDADGMAIPIRYDLDALALHDALGLLLLHHHGVRGERVEAVPLEGDFPDLRIEQAASPIPVAPGGLLVHRITIENAGSATAFAVELSDTLAPEVDSFEPTSSDPACSAVPGAVQCLLGDLPPGARRELDLALRIDAGATPGTSTENLAEVRVGSGFEGNLLDNASTLVTPISLVVPTLEKSVSGTLEEGGAVVYELVLENIGVGDQTDLPGPELVDALPPELILRSASASSGSVSTDLATNRVEWNGILAVSSPVVIEIVATLADGTSGQLVANQARASYDGDLDGAFGGAADGEVASDDPSTPVLGDPTTFVASPAAIEVPVADPRTLLLFALALALAAKRALSR